MHFLSGLSSTRLQQRVGFEMGKKTKEEHDDGGICCRKRPIGRKIDRIELEDEVAIKELPLISLRLVTDLTSSRRRSHFALSLCSCSCSQEVLQKEEHDDGGICCRKRPIGRKIDRIKLEDEVAIKESPLISLRLVADLTSPCLSVLVLAHKVGKSELGRQSFAFVRLGSENDEDLSPTFLAGPYEGSVAKGLSLLWTEQKVNSRASYSPLEFVRPQQTETNLRCTPLKLGEGKLSKERREREGKKRAASLTARRRRLAASSSQQQQQLQLRPPSPPLAPPPPPPPPVIRTPSSPPPPSSSSFPSSSASPSSSFF
ncbi:shootin-1-like [Camellia sinensis]|uniref:shootin-1-like n=1 Tax=Camellia sinensis TaxID=4442 RepID=UPI00103604EE|nr:shootin-1-like [Camellia sinensis]